jgi:hypothetical protein
MIPPPTITIDFFGVSEVAFAVVEDIAATDVSNGMRQVRATKGLAMLKGWTWRSSKIVPRNYCHPSQNAVMLKTDSERLASLIIHSNQTLVNTEGKHRTRILPVDDINGLSSRAG